LRFELLNVCAGKAKVVDEESSREFHQYLFNKSDTNGRFMEKKTACEPSDQGDGKENRPA